MFDLDQACDIQNDTENKNVQEVILKKLFRVSCHEAEA